MIILRNVSSIFEMRSVGFFNLAGFMPQEGLKHWLLNAFCTHEC